jgi:hypothetical protein
MPSSPPTCTDATTVALNALRDPAAMAPAVHEPDLRVWGCAARDSNPEPLP